jgi:hypothetical protein
MSLPRSSYGTKGFHFQDVDECREEQSKLHHMNATCRGFVERLDHVKHGAG